MRKVEYIEFAKLEMANDENIRFKALSFCYDNILVFKNEKMKFNEKDIGKVYKLIYQYADSGCCINSFEEVSSIPVRQRCEERVVNVSA